ncbi:MAG TPA: Stk1 family PASTA domain-containing Ser/Thr kinase [Firmicutes bacterium]|nr:Stk1 family PASTA domain-containing Ser/Thr kinase [Bacillota bacterium]
MLGRVLAQRYEIESEIGAGGMAIVYLGQDRLLCRPVAVKVLRENYAKDEDFVRRFRLEAQAAASLSHPNVVNIYDVGEEDGIYYLVMEYLAGTDLKTLIKQRGKLSVGQGLWVAAEIAKALEHAHAHKIVHRDIKPHNIVLTRDGRIKVTDFGIARAVSSSTLTQTGFVLGSVHYSSPEQVSGGQISGAADLYSLGVVMYEMFTGHLPFEGETPVSIALKHLREEPPAIESLRPDLPAKVALIVKKAMAKDPKDRFANAGQLLQAIWETGLMATGFDNTEESDEDLEDTSSLETTKLVPAVGNGELQPTEVVPEQKKPRRGSWGRKFLWTFLILILFAGLSWVGLLQARKMIFPPDVPVPDVRGMPVEEASEVLQQAGLKPSIDQRVHSLEVPEGWVISQDPRGSRIVKKHRTVELVVSRGPRLVEVPTVVGLSLRDAALLLDERGLKVRVLEEEASDDVEVDQILSQEPMSGSVPEGSSIDVVIAVRHKTTTVVVPDLRRLSLDQAEQELLQRGLAMGNRFPDFSDDVPEGLIIDQNPRPEAEVPQGTTVDVVYSHGPRMRPETKAEIPDTVEPPPASKEEAESEPEEPPTAPVEPTPDGLKRATITIRVPDGPPQEVLVLVVDDTKVGIRQVMQELVDGGETIVREAVGYGPEVRVQVYVGGWLILEEYLR